MRSIEGVGTDCLNNALSLFLRQRLYVFRDGVQHRVQNLFVLCFCGPRHLTLHYLVAFRRIGPPFSGPIFGKNKTRLVPCQRDFRNPMIYSGSLRYSGGGWNREEIRARTSAQSSSAVFSPSPAVGIGGCTIISVCPPRT